MLLMTVSFSWSTSKVYTLCPKIKEVSYSERKGPSFQKTSWQCSFFQYCTGDDCVGYVEELGQKEKNSAKNTSTASRTQRSTRVKKLQRLSLFQQQIRWNLCLVQTQRKKEKNEKSNWIFLFFFSLHGSPRRIIWVQQRYLKDFSINNQQIFIGSNLILRENKKTCC